MGLVMLLDGFKVVAVDDRGADLVSQSGARQRYRIRPLPAHTVALWDIPDAPTLPAADDNAVAETDDAG